jgi:DMSO/TMAO reductase YedYZ molybdopterin-dependent catalytic subunit
VPGARRPAPRYSDSPLLTPEELALATRNHGTPLEALRHSRTPAGLHYTLAHYDIPAVAPSSWRLSIQGRVRRPRRYTLQELTALPAVTHTVTMECAGNGRAYLSPRPVNQPWLLEAVGTAAWTGVALRALLDDAGVLPDAVEVLAAGLDRGVRDGEAHSFERSLPLADALADGVLLAYAMDGGPLPEPHGFPLRLVVAGWYGMAHVKWLSRIEVLAAPLDGPEQRAYRMARSNADPGIPLTRMRVRALMIPPGIPEFPTRLRHLHAGTHVLRGRAWSGGAGIAAVAVSVDGAAWRPARLEPPESRASWCAWSVEWAAGPGDYLLCCRATDERGDTQPLEPEWNAGGMANNAVQRIPVRVA